MVNPSTENYSQWQPPEGRQPYFLHIDMNAIFLEAKEVRHV
ncbi:MAG: hypothetical protein ACH255_19950 [Candidatus Thiodiazotropha sp.]